MAPDESADDDERAAGHDEASAGPPGAGPRVIAMVADESADDDKRTTAGDDAASAGPPAAGPRDATRGGVNRPAPPAERGRESPLWIDPYSCAVVDVVERAGPA